MKNGLSIIKLPGIALVALLFFTATAFGQDAPSACVELGALAYDNWSKTDSGGSGMPAGEADNDYIRCKACHGWDRMATEGGYVRRSRNSGRPNAGAGDSDKTSRVISPFMGGHDPITADMILHSGTGRSWADGTGSWVPLEDAHSAANKAAHAQGYTLGNQHPDLSADGANMGDVVLTQEQLDCLVEFLNLADADPSAYFSSIDPSQNPVLYTIIDTADANAGETFYNENCGGCHGDPAEESPVGEPEGGILAYLANDGKFSEFAHKVRWGIPDESMTREAMGSPTSADLANMMLWLQELGGTGFAMTPGLSGHWWDSTRQGEGFLMEVAWVNDQLFAFISFYAYDANGDRTYLFAQGFVDPGSNSVDLEIVLPEGGVWGDAFDENNVMRPAWGAGTFTFHDCDNASYEFLPKDDSIALGYTARSGNLTRDLLDVGIACPTPTAN